MTFPFPSTTYVDPELVTSANLYSRVLAVINTLGGFLYGEAEGASTDTVTITATSTDFIVPASAVTFTLAQQRRVRIITAYRYTAITNAATVVCYATYVAGSSATLTGAVKLGQPAANELQIPSAATAAGTVRAEHSVLLAAGTYTAFPVVNKPVGGTASDTAYLGYCAVYDAGAS